MKIYGIYFILIFCSFFASGQYKFEISNSDTLKVPAIMNDTPEPGKTALVTPKEYAGTKIYHTIYLPKNWKKNNKRYPIIFEYTGNYFPPSGSSGKVEDAALGFGLSAGKFIWVSLPYIAKNKTENQLSWWGDEKATVEYAKKYVPEIIEEFGGDTNAVFLCGFSRGAIAVNYLGLHDDEVAKLWTAFITHDHFDGVKAWGGTKWGSPLEKYRKEAAERLKRVNGRPYLVIQNGEEYGTKSWVESVLSDSQNFSFLNINTTEIFGEFPNKYAQHEHCDTWLLIPGKYRDESWDWIRNILSRHDKD